MRLSWTRSECWRSWVSTFLGKSAESGYLIHFSWRKNGLLISDHIQSVVRLFGPLEHACNNLRQKQGHLGTNSEGACKEIMYDEVY